MTISKTAALAEAIKRRDNRDNYNKVELKGDFPEQDAFINDSNRYVSAQCSRRSGKTTGLAIRFFKAMEKHPKSQCLYLSLTQDSARSILWPVLQELDEKYKIGCVFTESKLEVKHPNGSKLKLMGADLKNFIKRLRGRKYPAVAIDEVQDMGPHVQSLIDDVLVPSIADYADGWLAITGTPGPVPQGYFFDVTQSGKYGYNVHKWTIVQNPHMPNPQAIIDDLKAKNEWDDSNPTLRREWYNQWVLDVDSLWIRYKEEVCHFDILPKNHQWTYLLGVDIGYKDADALAVIAWSETCPETYLVEELITPRQDITALAEQIKLMQDKYKIAKTVMDEGGLGKKAAEEIRRRYGLAIHPADKIRKQENVELLNDAMRRGKFKAKRDSRFAKDSYLIPIDWSKSTPDRIVIVKSYHSDIIDSVLYAFKESYGYTHAPEQPKLIPGSRLWYKKQEEDMFQLTLDRAEAENSDFAEDKYKKWLEKGE